MSVRFITAISVIALLGACSSTKESPIYQQSTKYKVHSPTGATTSSGAATTSYANYSTGSSSNTQTVRAYNNPAHSNATYSGTTYQAPATYQASTHTASAPTTMVNHECLNKESNRKLLGTGVGGAAGALAGNELIGGTKGVVIGAVVGGAAGYGIADKTVDCDPIPVQQQPQVQTYQPAPVTYSQQAPSTTYSTNNSAVYTASAPAPMQAPAPAPTTSVATTAPQTAPTDTIYGDTFGTPGYHAMQANGEGGETTNATNVTTTAPAPQPALPQTPSYPQTAQQNTYGTYNGSTAGSTATQSYGSGTVTTTDSYNAGNYNQGGYMTNSYGATTTHEVVEGDTVYSMSRRLCVDVEDIQRVNGLDGNFSIQLGQTIQLPASRC